MKLALQTITSLSMFIEVFAGCLVDLDRLTGRYPPLLLQNQRVVLPTAKNKRLIVVDEKSKLELYCHGGLTSEDSTLLSAENLPKQISAKLTCSNGSFLYKSAPVLVETVSCPNKQEPYLISFNEICSPVGADGRKTNLQDLWTIHIGWLINNTFMEQIQVCHDELVYGTILTSHILEGASISFRDKDVQRPHFRTDNAELTQKRYFDWTSNAKMNKMYSKTNQADMIASLLGENKIFNKPLIDTSSKGAHYFAKGHLSPDADFIYNVQQDATYYFFNVAPQFQSFNNGNWKALETNTRDLAKRLGRDIHVYTGTHGILKYPDINNNPTPIHLFNSKSTKYVPVPEYYWKVVHDPSTGLSAAFIGLNNPHVTQPPTELCNNVCKSLSWVDWSYTKLDAGYMYCCTVDEARKAIKSIPKLTSVGLIEV